jgi:hypothetical protein
LSFGHDYFRLAGGSSAVKGCRAPVNIGQSRQGEAAPVRHPPVRHPKVYKATCFCLVELENLSPVRAREGAQAGLKPSRIDWKE